MAFGIEGFNLQSTPALQRKLQRIRSRQGTYGLQSRSGLEAERAIREDVGRQFNKYLASRTSRRRFDTAKSRLQHGMKSLDVEREKGLSSHLHRMKLLGMKRRALEDQRDDAFKHGLFGLGGLGLGIWHEKKARQRDLEFQKARNLEQYQIMDALRKQQLGIPFGTSVFYGGR